MLTTDQPTSPFASDPAAIAAIARMRRHNPDADPLTRLPDVHPARIPRHIAIIMDGNGRWAVEKGFPRQFGHLNGARSVREVLQEAVLLGVEVLTLYSFSVENWKRPQAEVDALMDLCIKYLDGEREAMVRKGIRFRTIGRREGLPGPVLEAIDKVTQATANCRRATLCLAINYGSRAEITDAVRAIAGRVAAGELSPDSIDESTVEHSLYTHGLPDPDLLVRTAGEMRVSNYLLWQISYAEIHVTPTYWPEFGPQHLHSAIRDYAGRQRRFGAVEEAPSHA
ncbi:MAG: di-trans,poly-cis-decaprenylcistransferase [Phycisphaeraceae bacterium]|nr:di-trans,poly-cis-decaprenylcistransferase [Phycisphaeraceae bacterium]